MDEFEVKLSDLFTQLITELEQSDVFFGHGVAVAEDEVILLLMQVTGLEFETLNQSANMAVSEEQVQHSKKLLYKRINEQLPMAYVLGFCIFAGLRFEVDERALVPRSPFAELIDVGFQPYIDMNKVHKVLDLCTGSGCIGLALAHYYDHLTVELSDLESKALELANINVQKLGLSQRAKCIQSDLFTELQGSYDLIVSNPPYVGLTEYNVLPNEFKHEPKSGLVSELSGLEIPIQILINAADYLSENGSLFMEVGYSDALLASSFPEIPFEWIEFEQGGQGICVFNRKDLLKYQNHFTRFMETHVT